MTVKKQLTKRQREKALKMIEAQLRLALLKSEATHKASVNASWKADEARRAVAFRVYNKARDRIG